MNPVKCQSLCRTCGAAFIYHTTTRTLRYTCDTCTNAPKALPKAPRLKVVRNDVEPRMAREPTSSTSDEQFIIAWNMCDSMDDLLVLLPEYNDPDDSGKGRGRARNRGYMLRKDGHPVKMMPKALAQD